MIRPGNRVLVGTGCAAPATLLQALEHLEQNLKDVKLYHFFTQGAVFYENGLPKTRFQHKFFYVNSDMAALIRQGRGDYIPIPVAQIPKLMKAGGFPVDVALIQVSMPDPYGYVSLGISCDITHAAIQKASAVIAELNPGMPRTSGETSLHIGRIDSGMINGKEKTIHKGLVVASFCIGSRRLYARLNNNPLFSFHPMEYVCDPSILAQNSKLVSITQAQTLDLMGRSVPIS